VTEKNDETIARVSAALREMPHVDASAKARVLVAVAAERERDRERASARGAWRRRLTLGAGVAAAAGIVALLAVRGIGSAGDPAVGTNSVAARPVLDTQSSAAAAAALASHAADDANSPRPVELVFRAPTAHSVRVVGDFTGWRQDGPLMQRDEASGLWSVTVTVAPGRHVYAFLVDDSVLTRDPRAPVANDADFGRPGSVMLVGRP
jgi:hypothetical protein